MASAALATTLQGRDLSRNNTQEHLKEALNWDFLIVKATEGNGHADDPNCVDPQHDSFVKAGRAVKLLIGHYHVCHPENDPIADAAWFVKYADPQWGDILAADLEPYYRSDWDWAYVVDWLLKFLAHVELLIGAVPVVYLNDDVARHLMAVATAKQKLLLTQHYGLWKADPDRESVGETYGFVRVLLWQYNQVDIDKNVFLGDREAWQLIAVPQKEEDMGFKGPQYRGFDVFGYPKLCETWQIEGAANEVRALPHPAGTSIHILEYEIISPVHDSVNSWHYWFDNNHALAMDVNLEGCSELEEFAWLRDYVAPVMKKWGLAITCPIDTGGYGVPGHSIGDGLHCHGDMGSWSNTGTGSDRFAPWNKKLDRVPYSNAVVKKGDTGELVKEVQEKVGVARDGVFGDKTEKAVKALQRRLNHVNRHNIDLDGAWGPETRSAYEKFCDGQFGRKTIRLWQYNADTPEDGVISRPSTLIEKVQRSSVVRKKVRKKYQLTGKEVDGILGPDTWKMIQDWLGVNPDGVPGPITVKALQEELLRGGW